LILLFLIIIAVVVVVMTKAAAGEGGVEIMEMGNNDKLISGFGLGTSNNYEAVAAAIGKRFRFGCNQEKGKQATAAALAATFS